jgi:hypothetical protein
MQEIAKTPQIDSQLVSASWHGLAAKLTKVRFRRQGRGVLSLSVAVLTLTSLIALWLRSASLPLVNFVS